jgi:hypothetical protein
MYVALEACTRILVTEVKLGQASKYKFAAAKYEKYGRAEFLILKSLSNLPQSDDSVQSTSDIKCAA